MEKKLIVDQAVLAAELSGMSGKVGGDRITQEQFDARSEKIKEVMEFRKSGRFRILSVDTYDYADGELVYDFDAKEDALMYVSFARKQNQAVRRNDLKSMREASRKAIALSDGEMTARALEPGITVDKLLERLGDWTNITSEVMFLYNPQGDLIGEFAI